MDRSAAAHVQPRCNPGAQPQTRRLTASLETKVVIRVSTRLTSLCVDADFQWRSSSYRLSTSWLLAVGQRVGRTHSSAWRNRRLRRGQQLAVGLLRVHSRAEGSCPAGCPADEVGPSCAAASSATAPDPMVKARIRASTFPQHVNRVHLQVGTRGRAERQGGTANVSGGAAHKVRINCPCVISANAGHGKQSRPAGQPWVECQQHYV